jgi:hypothetical protein
VPLRLTITNVTDQPVIFVRPYRISFLGSSTGRPVQLFVDLVSATGERIGPALGTVYELKIPLQTAEMFSMLPPGESCTVDLDLVWNKTFMPLEVPIPAGNYTMRGILAGSALGPDVEMWGDFDIGAWVGTTDPSNEVTLTVLPPEE